MTKSILGAFLLAASSCLIAGCNKPAPKPVEKLVPVGGKVTIEGKPEAGVQVIFAPMGDNKNSRGGSGVTDANGAFQLKNYMQEDGVPAGQYIVTFSWMEKPSGGAGTTQIPIPGVTAKERIPPKWNDAAKSGRHNRVTIPEAGKKDLEYKVTAK